jgi:hypothetical protein
LTEKGKKGRKRKDKRKTEVKTVKMQKRQNNNKGKQIASKGLSGENYGRVLYT